MIDNLKVLGGDALDGTITAKTVGIRPLGTQTTVHVPWRTVLYATGNNLTYLGDTARRVVQITLDPQEEKPDHRTDFVHPDLRKHVQAAQRTYLSHACTLLLAYVAAGAPSPTSGYGSFEEWNALIRGCVEWVTGSDPLEGQDKQMEEDEAIVAWRQLLQAWHTCIGEHGKTIAQALEEMKFHTQQQDGTYISKHAENWLYLRESFTALDKKGDGTHFDTRSLGAAFRRHKKRIFNGLRMIQEDLITPSAIWKVQTVPTSH